MRSWLENSELLPELSFKSKLKSYFLAGLSPAHEKDKSGMTEKELHIKPGQLSSSQDGESSPENCISSCSEYDESNFASTDDLYSEDKLSLESEESNMSNESTLGSSSESSELRSEASKLNSESDYEFHDDPSSGSNKSLDLHIYSESHKSHPTKKNKLPPGKKNVSTRKCKPQDVGNGLQAEGKNLPAVTNEFCARHSKSNKEPLTESTDSYSQNQTGKNVSYAGKTKHCTKSQEAHTGKKKLSKLKNEPQSGESNKFHIGKAKQLNNKSNTQIKQHQNGKTNIYFEKHERQIKKSPEEKSRPHAGCGLSQCAEQKERSDKSESRVGHLRYTRKKTSSSKRKRTLAGKVELQSPKSELQTDQSRIHPQKSELRAERSRLRAGKSKLNVQKRELNGEKSNLNVQERELLHSRGNKRRVQKTEFQDGRNNKADPQQKGQATESSKPAYTWKVPATVWLAPTENVARFLFDGTTQLSDSQAPLLTQRRQHRANQLLSGNQWANIQAWSRLNQLHPRKNVLPLINTQLQNGKNWSPYRNSHKPNTKAETFNPDATAFCSRCTHCWYKWFHNSL